MWQDLEVIVSKLIASSNQGTEDQIKAAEKQWSDFLATVRKLVPPATVQEAA